jgi:hypothetical protein
MRGENTNCDWGGVGGEVLSRRRVWDALKRAPTLLVAGRCAPSGLFFGGLLLGHAVDGAKA